VNPHSDWYKALFRCIDPYSTELNPDRVIGALFDASGGSDEGRRMADEWYRRRSDYPGAVSLLFKWQSLQREPECLDGFAALCYMVEADGFDPLDICSQTEPDFEPCEYISTPAEELQPPPELAVPTNALTRYSLTLHRDEVARTAVDQVHVLGRLALTNQLTAIFGPPAIGKSLMMMSLMLDAITQGKLKAGDVFYLDCDTNPTGLLEKIDLAATYGFNVVSDGYLEFSSRKFLEVLDELIAKDQASGKLLILDTLKKFVSIMDKERSSAFANRLRRFSKAGGACVALAHVNKHGTADGKPIYAGTSDILEDFDCAYLMYEVASDAGAQTKSVMFENIKARGDVARQASYRYSIREGLTYIELLESVAPVDDAELAAIERSEILRADAALIDAIRTCIERGILMKMELSEAAAMRAKATKRAALSVIDKYCGTDRTRHLWNFAVHERGAKKYFLLDEKIF
jgi:hypothetical protein